MAVGKRLRYEVLRRDNHTCRYCGRSAPEVRLTVDHVLPVALGGRDDSANLVACCADCNSGKTSTTPDAPLVTDVQESALRWSAAMHAAIAQASADLQAQLEYRRRFLEVWNAWKVKGTPPYPLHLGDAWEGSVETFRVRGLPIELLLEGIRTAMAAQHVKPDNIFRYLCGIAWKQIEKIDATARALFDGATPTPSPSRDERLTAAVLECAALAWDGEWVHQYGQDPPDGLEAEVHTHAAELYPEEISAAQLVAAAELAGRLGSTALADFVDDGEEEPLEEQIAYAFTMGWSAHHQTSPTPTQWQTTFIQALAANVAGYTTDSVAQAVMQAASEGAVDADGDLDVFAALATPRGLLLEAFETFAEMARGNALTQEQLDGRMGIALHWRESRRRAREEREARGESPDPWIPEQ